MFTKYQEALANLKEVEGYLKRASLFDREKIGDKLDNVKSLCHNFPKTEAHEQFELAILDMIKYYDSNPLPLPRDVAKEFKDRLQMCVQLLENWMKQKKAA
jgi:hypothetical protein